MHSSVLPSRKFSLNAHWSTQELVTIGVFAAVTKLTTLLVAFAGGGMNPASLIAKNCLFAMLMIVLLHKVPKIGTLTLATLVGALVALLLMGQGVMHAPGAIFICLLADGLVHILGGYGKTRNLVIGILVYEIGAKAIGIFFSWLTLREQPALMIPIASFIAIGCIGTFLGLAFGVRFTRELRRAGIIAD